MRDEDILQALREVVDPEIGINIVDLGLVYSVQIGDGEVRAVMTMTTPACPMNAHLREAAEAAIRRRVAGANSVRVDVVWDPPWTPAMMSPAARKQLGQDA